MLRLARVATILSCTEDTPCPESGPTDRDLQGEKGKCASLLFLCGALMCSYNCSAPPPPLTGDNDINGIGVIINYIATAAIAVLVIIVYYIAVYEPALDASSKLGHMDTPVPFRPNPVDVVLLRWLRHLPRKMLGNRQVTVRKRARLESTFIKCFLAMSDLQIVTGLSILISGFAQFPCGLATYYWMLIVELAWFSSLTHLSCLTLLRTHLYSRTTERSWRLFAMGCLATMLVVGLAFTGNYHWAYDGMINDRGPYSRPSPTDQTICYLHVEAQGSITFWSMIFSVCLIIMAFISRVVKLHRTLSVGFIGRIRAFTSSQVRKALRPVYDWCSGGKSPRGLGHLLIYRPMFGIFLALRTLIDGWTSVGVEVAWLLLSFAWGITRLWNTIEIQKSERKFIIEDDDSQDWSFGQVVAMVLLAAPIITILEYFDHNAQNDNATSVTGETFALLPQPPGPVSPPTTTPLNESLVDVDHPDTDWHSLPATASVSFVFSFWACVLMCVIFFIVGAIGTTNPVLGLNQLLENGFVWLALPMLATVIMFSLLIQTELAGKAPWKRGLCETLNVCVHLASLVCAKWFTAAGDYMAVVPVGIYFVVCSCLGLSRSLSP